MKKIFKTAVNLMACAMITVATLGLSACEDIKNLDLTLSLYNATDKVFYDEAELSVELYRHLAPKTVDAIRDLADKGYYDGAIFYQETNYSSQIMVGDLKLDENGKPVQNLIDGKLPSEIIGAEFTANGTTGSDLLAAEGYIGLWRSYYASDNSYKTSSSARNSGTGTWFIPTSAITSYDGYFCIFAKYDKTNETNNTAINALKAVFSNSENYTEYVIFYTGDYEAGLTFNAVKKTDWNENYDAEAKTYNDTAVFVAEGNQLVYYNYKTVKIPNVSDGKCYAQIKSVK